MRLEPEEYREQMETLTESDKSHLREVCQTDLYFLGKAILNYDQIQAGAHAALCNFMVGSRSARRMVLMPRGHLKTTLCTITDAVRLTLIDPMVRILIQNEVEGNAIDMLKELKGHWETNELLRFLFPELVPPSFSGRGIDWSQNSASVLRPRRSKESTYTAAGSGSSPQSKHFSHIKNDDLIGEKHKESELEMQRAIRWADSQIGLLDGLDAQLDFYGTRKTLSDVYSHTMEKYEDELEIFLREPIENSQPIFPLKYPLKRLEHIMIATPEVWAHDFMNNPIGRGGIDWGKGFLRNYHLAADEKSVVFDDHLTNRIAFWNLHELDVVITVDPNSGKLAAPDKAAIVVHGVSPREQIFVLDSWSARVDPDGLVDKIWELSQRWHPRVVGIEDAGQQNTLFYFEKRCIEEMRSYHTRKLQHKNTDKESRIRHALAIPLRARRVYVQSSQLTLIGQIQLFPQLARHNWDEIDSFSYGPELYQRGMSLEELAADEEAEELILEGRGITGYGVSV